MEREDKNEKSVKGEHGLPETKVKDILKQDQGFQGNVPLSDCVDSNGGDKHTNTSSGEVNMEACIVSEDVIRAGGFGARDDISSFLPIASDSTDFEASLRDARNYEEPQEPACRPGLGWTEATKSK